MILIDILQAKQHLVQQFPSIICTVNNTVRENIWPEVMAYGPSAARSVRHDQVPDIFPFGLT